MRAKRAGKIFKLNCRERSERKIFGKFALCPPNSSKLRSDYLFSFQKRTNYLFPVFSRSEIYFQKVPAPPPPPSESNGRPLNVSNISTITMYIFYKLSTVYRHFDFKYLRFAVIIDQRIALYVTTN